MKKKWIFALSGVVVVALAIILIVLLSRNTEGKTDNDATEKTTIQAEIVATDAQGNLVDAATGETLSTEEVEKLKETGVITVDDTGKVAINEEKNTQTVEVITDEKGDIISAKNETGKDITKEAKNNEKIKETVRTEIATERSTSGKKAEVNTETTEKPISNTTESGGRTTEKTPATEKATEKQTSTERTTSATTPTEKPTAEKTTQATEKPTEKETSATEKPTQSTSNTSARQEDKTEATEKRTEQTTQSTERKTERDTEAPQVCAHNWVWKTHNETVHHDAVYEEVQYLISKAYDEEITEEKLLCNTCLQTFDNEAAYRDPSHACRGGSSTWIDLVVGTRHHDAVYGTKNKLVSDEYDETITVNDYQYCSKCGEKK